LRGRERGGSGGRSWARERGGAGKKKGGENGSSGAGKKKVRRKPEHFAVCPSFAMCYKV
jgi:hypothetical protein